MAEGEPKIGGKHAALWERMKSKQRPQTIHRPHQTDTTTTMTEPDDLNGTTHVIPTSITMSPDASQESSTEQETTNNDDDSVIGTDLDQTNNTWAMMDHEQPKEEKQSLLGFLDTSFVSTSTTQEQGPESPMLRDETDTVKHKNTPGICWNQWRQDVNELIDNGDTSANPLFLDSMMLSLETTTEAEERERDSPNQSRLSLASSKVSPLGTPRQLDDETKSIDFEHDPTLPPHFQSPLTALRRNTMHQALQESHTYLKRIYELEEACQSFQKEVQMEREKRMALEQTPSSVLERNKTLVKEVRFAEQTCVEMSQQNAALQSRMEQLETNLNQVRKEKESIMDEMVEANRYSAKLETQKEALEQERDQLHHDFQAKEEQLVDSQRTIQELWVQLEQAKVGSVKLEMEELKARCAEQLEAIAMEQVAKQEALSERDAWKAKATDLQSQLHSHKDLESSPSLTSQVLAKTLQSQLERGHSVHDRIVALERELAEVQTRARAELVDEQTRLQENSTLVKQLQTENRRLQEERDRFLIDQAIHKNTETTPTKEESLNNLKEMEQRVEELQTKLAYMSEELQVTRAAESSAKHSLADVKVQLTQVQKERDELVSIQNKQSTTPREPNGVSPNKGVEQMASQLRDAIQDKDALAIELNKYQERVQTLEQRVQSLVEECQEHEQEAANASDKITELEKGLVNSMEQASAEKQRLQEQFLEMTNAALGNIELQTLRFQHQVESRTHEYGIKLNELSHAIQVLRDSLDFQSDSGSDAASTSREHTTTRGHRGDDVGIKDEMVLNATMHHDDHFSGPLDNEMLLEQMEEARLLDDSTRQERYLDGEENDFGGISQIEGISHLYDDISELISDCASKPGEREEFKKTHYSVMSDGNSSTRSSMRDGLESVEEECQQLRETLDRLRGVTIEKQGGLQSTVDDQKLVIMRLEGKIGTLSREAMRIEEERHVIHHSLRDVQKAYSGCRSELRDTKVALEASIDAHHRVQRELELTVASLHEKSQIVAALERQRSELSVKSQQLSESLHELSQKHEIQIDRLEKASREEAAKLRKQIEDRGTQLEAQGRHAGELARKLEEATAAHQDNSSIVAHLESALRQSDMEMKKLKESYIVSNEKLSKITEVNSQNAALATHYEREMHTAKALATKTEQENASLKASSFDMQAALVALEEKLVKSTNTLEQKSETIARLESEHSQLLQKAHETAEQLRAASEERRSLVRQLQQSHQVHEERERDISRYSSRVAQLSEQLEQAQKEQEMARMLCDELADRIDHLTSSKANDRLKIDELHSALRQANHEIDRLKISYITCNDKLANVAEQSANKDAIVDQFRTANSAAKNMISNADSKLSDARRELNEALAARNELQARVADVEDELRLATEKFSALKQHMEVSVAEHEGEIEDLQSTISNKDDELKGMERQIKELQNEMYELCEDKRQLQQELREEHLKAESLADQLRMAEGEVLATATEIAQTSNALSDANEELTRVHEASRIQEGTIRDLTKATVEAHTKLAETTMELKRASKSADNSKQSIKRLTEQLEEKSEEGQKLLSKNASLERKCTRLREYIRKLTTKCEEWAESYERQVTRHDGDGKRQEVSKPVIQHEELHGQEWSAERKTLQRVQSIMEEDLDDIAAELSNIGLERWSTLGDGDTQRGRHSSNNL